MAMMAELSAPTSNLNSVASCLPEDEQRDAAATGADGMKARVQQRAEEPSRAELLCDLEAAQFELEDARERISIMAQNDKDGVIDRLLSRIAALESHNDSLFDQKAVAYQKLDYYTALIDRLKQMLKVDSSSRIESAVRQLVVVVA